MWLRLKEDQTVKAILDISSIISVVKHWTGSRLEPCFGKGCPLCVRGIPRRWRYQIKLFIDDEEQFWEFGEEPMRSIQQMQHESSRVSVYISRIGKGKNTRYRIEQSVLGDERRAASEPGGLTGISERKQGMNKYTSGRYGHLVRT